MLRRSAKDFYISYHPPTELSVQRMIEKPDFSQSSISDLINDLTQRIYHLRELDFDAVFENVLVKDNRNIHETNLYPISVHEGRIQAMRYINGMLHIANNVPDEKQKNYLLAEIKKISRDYIEIYHSQDLERAALLTHVMADDFAKLLKHVFFLQEIKHARKQVTMARDLGILLETHRSVVTLQNIKLRGYVTHTMVEQSQLSKVSPDYYDREFHPQKSWYKIAKHKARLPENSWLDNFFSNNMGALRSNGIPAPPSARWLPIPANTQIVDTYIVDPNAAKDSGRYFLNVRMGIPTAFEVSGDKAEQKRLAKEQLKDILRNNITIAFEKYIALYDKHAPKTQETPPRIQFFVSYQTLLSPLPLIDRLNIKDNNSRFAKMARKQLPIALQELDHELVFPGYEVKLESKTTNTPINKLANVSSFTLFKDDADIRHDKLAMTANFIVDFADSLNEVAAKEKFALRGIAAIIKGASPNYLARENLFKLAEQLEANELDKENKWSPSVKKELAMRMCAAFHLRALMANTQEYSHLQTYQRNIMQSALEYIVMGSGALNIISCKSTRDRTGIMDCAIKAMLTDPRTMQDWIKLNQGIKLQLKHGHNLRSMCYHTPVLKASMVHANFGFEEEKVRTTIGSYLPFTKVLGEPKKFVKQNKIGFFGKIKKDLVTTLLPHQLKKPC